MAKSLETIAPLSPLVTMSSFSVSAGLFLFHIYKFICIFFFFLSKLGVWG